MVVSTCIGRKTVRKYLTHDQAVAHLKRLMDKWPPDLGILALPYELVVLRLDRKRWPQYSELSETLVGRVMRTIPITGSLEG